MAELILVPFVLFVVMVRGAGGMPKTRIFRVFLVAGCLSLLGYMISDVLAGTQPWQYLRGWGRVILVVSDSLMLMLLVGNDRQNMWWYVFGAGLGGVAYLYLHHVSFHQWKLGYGGQVVLVVIALAPLLGRRRGLLALGAFGVLNILLDYRNIGAGCIVTAAALWARSGHPMVMIQKARQYLTFILISVFGLAVLAGVLAWTHGAHAQRRYDSDVGRAAGIRVALQAIAASPFIGYGSWTVDPKYAQEIQSIKEKKGVRLHNAAAGPATLFRPHSEILQSWVEGGLLGASFFFVLLYQLVKVGTWVAMRRPLDIFSPMFLYLLVIGLWNGLASPFGGDQRLSIALAVAAIGTKALDARAAMRHSATQPTVLANAESAMREQLALGGVVERSARAPILARRRDNN